MVCGHSRSGDSAGRGIYDLDTKASALRATEGMLPGDKAFVGSLISAAKGFGAAEVLTGPCEGRSVLITQALGQSDVADGAPIGYVLLPVKLKDGQIAWLRSGDYVASIPCPPEES